MGEITGIGEIDKFLGRFRGREEMKRPVVFKAGMVERVDRELEEGGRDEAAQPLLKGIKSLTNYHIVTEQDVAQRQTTRVIAIPIGSLSSEVTGIPVSKVPRLLQWLGGATPSTSGNWNRNDVAICITFRIEGADLEGNAGQLNGIAVTNSSDADRLMSEIVADPTAIFRMAQTVNRGPVRNAAGRTAGIIPGEKAVILPNINFGGRLQQPLETSAFPANYQP